MPKRKPAAGRREPSSSRPRREEDPLTRIHRVRRQLEAKRKRLGVSELEYLQYVRQELRAKGHPL